MKAGIDLLLGRLRDGDPSVIDLLVSHMSSPCNRFGDPIDDSGVAATLLRDVRSELAQTLERKTPDSVIELLRVSSRIFRRHFIELVKQHCDLDRDVGEPVGNMIKVSSGDSVPLKNLAVVETHPQLSLWLRFHESAERLRDELGEVVDLRVYHGLRQTEVEELLGGPARTIRNRWLIAKLDLQRGCDLQTDATTLSSEIEALLITWDETRRAGQYLPAEELCEDISMVESLQQQIDRLLRMEALLCDTVDDKEPQDNQRLVEEPGSADPDSADFCTTSWFTSPVFHKRGGRGEISRAKQIGLQRAVAVKVLRRTGPKDPETKANFLFEAKATSQLDHPGVAPVYSVGETDDGVPFYAMRFIGGSTFESEICDFHETDWDSERTGQRRQALHRLLRHLVSAAKTIAYAHKRSLLNLDIKPLNIMVGKYGETLVIDWGEALPVEDPRVSLLRTEGPLPVASNTRGARDSSTVGGTLPYMAPERIAEGQYPVARSADIYSLGASLYQLLSGVEPFTQGSASRQEVTQRIQRGDLVGPSRLNPEADVPRALESICLKAMDCQPANRYSSALEFAEDIERWLDDEPVKAHAESIPDRLARWSRRHQNSTWAIGLALISVIALLGWARWSIGNARDRADIARENAEIASQKCLQLSARSTSRLVSRAFEERWFILRNTAEQTDLHAKIAAANQWLKENDGKIRLDDPIQKDLQRYLRAVYDKWEPMSHATSMLVLNTDGILLARVPEEENTKNIIGKSFRFRDYFHGNGVDYTEQEVEANPPKHILRQHVSIPFISRDNGSLRVQFTIPIKDEQETIGVVGMAVNISKFDELKLDASDEDHPLVLLDLRPCKIKEQVLSNLIMHHPQMSALDRYRVDDSELLARLERLLEIHRAGAPKQPISESWYDNYFDPVVKGNFRCAIEPLRVRRGTGNDRVPLKLVVLAQERISDSE